MKNTWIYTEDTKTETGMIINMDEVCAVDTHHIWFKSIPTPVAANIDTKELKEVLSEMVKDETRRYI